MFHRDREVSPTCEKVLELEPGNKHAMETSFFGRRDILVPIPDVSSRPGSLSYMP